MVMEASKKADACGQWVRGRDRSVAHVFDTLEDDMKLALKELKAVVGTTAVATSALSCGTGDRT